MRTNERLVYNWIGSLFRMAVTAPPVPETAALWQRLAVIYVLGLLAFLIAVHVVLECRQRMKWQKICWEHVAESSRGCSPWCLGLFRPVAEASEP